MSYRVKACYRTIQGEGVRTGRVVVLCRFSGCNLWSGRLREQAAAQCTFCDTDFLGTDGPGGGRFEATDVLADHVLQTWRDGAAPGGKPYVVFTGGEPVMQLDEALVRACQARGFEVGVETNGTLACPPGLDWICVSPKAATRLKQRSGDELKLVHPQSGVDPGSYEDLDFRFWSLQPLDGPERDANTAACVAYCLDHPRWRLSLQTHKYIGVP